jgi:hypothetical protein
VLSSTLTKVGTGRGVAATNNATSGDSGSSDGLPVWVWIVGAVVLLGGGVFFALRGGGGAKA